MAKVTVTCTCSECGKQFTITATKRNRAECDRFEEWASENITVCNECNNILQAKYYKSVVDKAIGTEDRPTLSGTEKQVKWANDIREEMLANLSKYWHTYPTEEYTLETIVKFAIEYFTDSTFWIDRRDDVSAILKSIIKCYNASKENADTASTAVPETSSNVEGVVQIHATDTIVTAAFRKDEEFRSVVKSLDYHFDYNTNMWVLAKSATSGQMRERAAELGNKLLNAGFAIHMDDNDLMQAAINADYEPATNRWIMVKTIGQYAGWFAITVPYKSGMYEKSIKITGSKYDKPYVVAPHTSADEVFDFAHENGYRLSAGAEEIHEELYERTIKTIPHPPKEAQYEEHSASDILESSRDIIDDLKD